MSAREVCLVGGSPWGFRMHGGCDQHQPLRISRVNPGSKAAQQGVREGDLISSINGKSTRELSNTEAHALLRNAGDQLRLGLNQENGSPKRRIYKSSLQENTSIETIKKTTTKTTTTNTQIITETKKNGNDDAKNEATSYEQRNGSVKSESTNDQQQQQLNESDKNRDNRKLNNSTGHIVDYATDSESTSCLGIKMPCGSRSRRNRRNRPRKKLQQSTASAVDASRNEHSDGAENEPVLVTVRQNGDVSQEPEECTKEDSEIKELAVFSQKPEQQKSPEEPPRIENPSSARSRVLRRNNRCRIEKKILNADTRICEIRTIRHATPLEAKIDYIPGVGIVESSFGGKNSCESINGVTISEPAEPLEPLSAELATRLESLPGARTCTALALPSKRFDFLEIREVTDSEPETDLTSHRPQGIIVEAESDLDEPLRRQGCSEDEEEPLTWERERQLRDFIEGLQLPSSATDRGDSDDVEAAGKLPESSCSIVGDAGREGVAKLRKREASPQAASTGAAAYQSQMSQESNRCLLGIIEEESSDARNATDDEQLADETKSDTRHIRDFINEEIGKFRREPRDVRGVLRNRSAMAELREIGNTRRKESEGGKEKNEDKRAGDAEDGKSDEAAGGVDDNVVTNKQACDIKVENVKIEKEENNAYAECRNVETFMNLVKSLKESVINDVQFEKTKETMSVTERKESIEKIDNEVVRETFIEAEKTRIVESKNLDKLENEKDTEEMIEVPIDSASQDMEETNIISKVETELKNFSQEVESKGESEESVKNIVSDILTDNVKQIAVSNEATNKTNEKNDKVNDKLQNNKIDEPKVLQLNDDDAHFINSSSKIGAAEVNVSDAKKQESEKDVSDGSVTEDNVDSITDEEFYPVTITEIESSENLSNPIATDSIINQNNDPSISKITVTQHESNVQSITQSSESLATEVDVASTANQTAPTTLNPQVDSQEERYIPVHLEPPPPDDPAPQVPPPPPRRATTFHSDLFYPVIEVPVFERIILIDRYPPAPPMRRFSRAYTRPYQPTLNGLELEEQLEVVDFTRSLLLLLSSNESTRQDVQELLSHHDLDRLPASIRCIVDDLALPRLRSAANTDLCNGEESAQQQHPPPPQPPRRADNKIGIARDLEEAAAAKHEAPVEPSSRRAPRSTTSFVSKTSETTESHSETITERSVFTLSHTPSPEQPSQGRSDDSSRSESNARSTSSARSGSKPEPPAPESPPDDDHLYYVPLLDEQANLGADAAKFSADLPPPPGTLRDLCVKKILSMPPPPAAQQAAPADGPAIPKFRHLKSLNATENDLGSARYDDDKWPYNKPATKPSKTVIIPVKISEDYSKKNHIDQARDYASRFVKPKCGAKETCDKRAKNWTGVPTKENPKILVCLSPAQQETGVRTSADNLLDLHKKFINRRGYHHDQIQSVSPPKYIVDVSPLEANLNDREPPSRLLSIIKENPIRREQALGSKAAGCGAYGSDPLPNQSVRWPDSAPAGDTLLIASDKPSAIDQPAARNVTPSLQQQQQPKRRSPISCSSAIIDRSLPDLSEYKRRSPLCHLGRQLLEPGYVNPALIIEDKPEVPPRIKRRVTVDPDCIDTRSIFDQTPLTKCAETTKRQPNAGLMADGKQATQLEKEQKRSTLPREYVDRQLKYIEQLQSQLKNVFKMDDEEVEGLKDPADGFRRSTEERRKNKSADESSSTKRTKAQENNRDDGCFTHEDHWQESRGKVEGENSEYQNREGSRETSREVKRENGLYTETSTERLEEREEREERSVTRFSSERDECKLKEFLRDLHEPRAEERPAPRPPKRERRESKRPSSSVAGVPTLGETFRQRMYDEYVHEVLEREERKQHKVIKISSHADLPGKELGSKRPKLADLNKVEQEFIEKARGRLNRQGVKLDESETEGASSGSEARQPDEEAKLLVDGQEVKDARRLPKHLREFIKISTANKHENDEKEEQDEEEKRTIDDEMIAPTFKASSAKPGVWSPGSESAKPPIHTSPDNSSSSKDGKDEPIPPVWTPSSAGPSPVPERKEFRPVPFESPVLSRKKITQPAAAAKQADTAPAAPWEGGSSHEYGKETGSTRIVNSYSAPAQGLNTLATAATAAAPRLPRAQNPTITLLQKAREGHLPKGAAYLDETDHIASGKEEKPLLSPGEVIYKVKKEYESEPEIDHGRPKKKAGLGPRKYEGIGPTTKNGIPIVLRSEVKESNQAKWYKQMYDSLHRAPKNDDYVTIRYKPHRGTRTGYSGTSSGYLSEPEPRSYSERSSTLDSRRHRQRHKDNDFSTLPRPAGRADGHYSPDTYHMNPGRIEDYVPGNCSIQEKETKEPPADLSWAKRKWWDEVMDIFDGWLDENGQLQSRDRPNGSISTPRTPSVPSSAALQRPRLSGLQTNLGYQPDSQQQQHRLTHSVSSSAASSGRSLSGSRSLRGSSSLEHRLYQQQQQAGRRPRAQTAASKIRRDLEIRDEQLRLRQSRLLESLFELAGGGVRPEPKPRQARPRSGSTGDSERRLIKPLADDEFTSDDWTYLGPLPGSAGPRLGQQQHQHHQQQQQQHLAQQHGLRPTAVQAATVAAQAQQAAAALSSSASSSSSVTNSSSNGTTTSTNHAAPFEQSNTHSPKSYMTHALKESGYESDSTLVFRRREDVSPLSPLEQRIAYKTVQKGGDVPLHGLRKPAPERPKDDTEIKYFSNSPTLTRKRVHRKTNYSSATTSPASSASSMNVSRIPIISMASSSSNSAKRPQTFASKNIISPPTSSLASVKSVTCKVPSPPKRKSSRNNRTLKLYSSSSKPGETLQSPTGPRHEQCFIEEKSSSLDRLRKERTLSASPVSSRRSFSGITFDSKKRRSEPCLSHSSCDSVDTVVSRVRSRVSSSASPVARSPKVPLSRKPLDVRSTIGKTLSKTSIVSSSRDLRSVDRICQHTSRTKTTSSNLRKEQKVRRGKKEQEESCKRLSKSTVDLTSPVEVRRVLQRQREKDRFPRTTTTRILPSGTFVKSSSAPLTSTLGSSRLKLNDKSLKVTVAISPKGREILRKSGDISKTTLISKPRSLCLDNMNESRRKKIKDKSSVITKSESKQLCESKIKRKDVKTCDKSLMKTEIKHPFKDTHKIGNPKTSNSQEKSLKLDAKTPALTIDLLRQHHEATMSDSFFQHLFLRNVPLSPPPSDLLRRSSVLDRARAFQEIAYSDSYKSEPSLKSLNIYLAHKRPVSNSRFKHWERESLSSRSSSPFGIKSSLPRYHRYGSPLRNEFGSSSSLRGRSPDLTRECPKERSLSEPPLKTLAESPDSISRRTQSPSPIRYPPMRDAQSSHQNDSDSASEILRKSRARSASEADYVRQLDFGSNLSLTRSTSSLMNFPIDHGDYQQYILEKLHSRQKSKRYRDLYDFYTSLERMAKLEETASSSDLRPRLKNEEIIDYERWKQVRAKEKAEQELKGLYRKLKLAQKEKDFLFSTRDVERFKWRGDSSLRCKERSVDSIKEQFHKLEREESELEALRQREIASKKDIYKPLWRGNSVVNVANSLTRKAAEKADFDRSSIQASLQKSLGGSNKFWSSLSIEQVTALKNQLNDIYGNDPLPPRKIIKKPNVERPPIASTASLANGIVKYNKDQEDATSFKQDQKSGVLGDIKQSHPLTTSYEIIVPDKKKEISAEDGTGLHVRCHSMIAPNRLGHRDEMKRSGSICRVSSLERSQSDRLPSSALMSEGEKKRLSLSLGREMLEKVNQKLVSSMVKPRETRGALAAALARTTSNLSPRTCSSIDAPISDDTSKSKEQTDFVLILTPSEDGPEQKERVEKVMKEWSKKPPVLAITPPEGTDQVDSATESSDASVKTVVRRNSECDDLQRKVEFYERSEREKSPSSRLECKLSSSQSFADLKELFGESNSARYLSGLGSSPRSQSASPGRRGKAEQIADVDRNSNISGIGGGDRGRGTSGSPDVVSSTRRSAARDHDESRPRSASPCCGAPLLPDYNRSCIGTTAESSASLESLWQSQQQRCGSPDPEKYWRSYLKLVRDGTVRRLRAKFESLEELPARNRLALLPKRFQSDPELARNLLRKLTDTSRTYIKPQEIPDVAWLRRKYEPPRGRRRRGRGSPIPRVPWRLEDLTMPHINVISKTAELKADAAARSLSAGSAARREETRELEARRPVNRLRELFERASSPESGGATSILGEMFTSAPNVHELRDIAPYLAGRWVAHQYPSRYDNSRSLSSPPDLSRGTSEASPISRRGSITPPSRKRRLPGSRSTSASPPRPRTPAGSILKPQPPSQQQALPRPTDIFANQPFDPSKHRPRFRYQPPPPPLPLLPPPKTRHRSARAWCPPMPTYNARPTVVTFEGPDSRPINV